MANPVFNESAFERGYSYGSTEAMTVQGTATKTMILLALCSCTAVVTWNFFQSNHPLTMPLVWGGAIGGLVLALITCFKAEWAAMTSPIYAVLEGLFLGGISAMYHNAFYPGIVIQAVCLTFGTMFVMLVAYRAGVIRATEKFRSCVIAATGAIMLVYIVSMVMRLFGAQMPFIHDNGIPGICFSIFVVGLAALNLILDFDFIERGAYHQAPKHLEWYGAFGLMVTLVWLYLEILRLLAKLSDR